MPDVIPTAPPFSLRARLLSPLPDGDTLWLSDGVVEVGVGVVPAAGGTKEMALRAHDRCAGVEGADPFPFLRRAFETIGMAKVATSGAEARQMFLSPADSLSPNPDRLLHEEVVRTEVTFKSLSPEERARLRQRFEAWQEMDETQHAELRRRHERLHEGSKAAEKSLESKSVHRSLLVHEELVLLLTIPEQSHTQADPPDRAGSNVDKDGLNVGTSNLRDAGRPSIPQAAFPGKSVSGRYNPFVLTARIVLPSRTRRKRMTAA